MDNNDPRLSQFPQVYMVEASAGSGKTYCLADRYVRLLTGSALKPEEIPLKTILAITFTNKAAIEMKERIIEFLKTMALFDPALEKRKKAAITIDYLIRNYNFFQVQTIDSFINSILYGCAFKLELSANFKTEELYNDYISYSFDRLIDKAGCDPKTLELFHKFLKQYIYIENKTSWFPKQSIISRLNALFSASNKYSSGFIRSNIDSDDIIARKKDILRDFVKLEKNLPVGTNALFAKKLKSLIQENENSFSIEDLSISFKKEFPANKGSNVPAEVDRLWAQIQKNIESLCGLEALSAFNYYIDIFNEVADILKDVSGRDDILFLDALNKRARGLFDEKAIGLPELYLRLAARFKHFLVDEFQDTSRLQWENIFPMVEEALSGDGSFFYVGDRKQAIYRFRAGEASLMDSVKLRFKDTNLIEESLLKNYRSRQSVVEFNNMVFSESNMERFLKDIKLSDTDKLQILDVFKGAKQTYRDNNPGGFVKVEFADNEETIKKSVLGVIEDLKKRFALGDIAILARKNEQAELFSSWLLENDIPVESEKTLNIRENSYIKEFVSLLKFLNSPIDNLSFASFILGDIFSSISGISTAQIQEFIFKLRCKSNKDTTYLYKEFRSRFPGAWSQFLEEFFKNVGFVPLYELLISILARFEVMDRFSSYQGFFMKFLELVKEEETENISISSFLEFFEKCPHEKLYVNVTKSDSVKVLTVHKAKGLEFGVVIIPSLEINAKVNNEVVIESREGLSLIRMKKAYANFSPNLGEIYQKEYKEALIDELNNMYVAFTRPADELYIFIPPKAANSLNQARLLFHEGKMESGKRQVYKKEKPKKQRAIMEISASLYKDWISLLKSEFSDENILEARQKILKGKVLHYILSFIGNLYSQDVGLIIKQAIEKAGPEFIFLKDFSEYKARISDLISRKSLEKYFFIKEADVFLEKEIVNKYGDTKRIDRLILTSKEAIIIDYKSSRELERADTYRDQVLEYIEIVKQIYPKLKVKGILIYLDDMTAHEVN